jgi:hypothetical protein
LNFTERNQMDSRFRGNGADLRANGEKKLTGRSGLKPDPTEKGYYFDTTDQQIPAFAGMDKRGNAHHTDRNY